MAKSHTTVLSHKPYVPPPTRTPLAADAFQRFRVFALIAIFLLGVLSVGVYVATYHHWHGWSMSSALLNRHSGSKGGKALVLFGLVAILPGLLAMGALAWDETGFSLDRFFRSQRKLRWVALLAFLVTLTLGGFAMPRLMAQMKSRETVVERDGHYVVLQNSQVLREASQSEYLHSHEEEDQTLGTFLFQALSCYTALLCFGSAAVVWLMMRGYLEPVPTEASGSLWESMFLGRRF